MVVGFTLNWQEVKLNFVWMVLLLCVWRGVILKLKHP